MLTVRSRAADAAAAVLHDHGVRSTAQRLPDAVRFIADVGTGEESPVARAITRDVARLGPAVVALRIP